MAVCTFFGHRECPEEIRYKLLGQHRIMGQGNSARDFGASESMKNAGILDVFPIFHTARLGQKIRRSPQLPLCGVALEVLVDLIENHNVDLFYVGNQGRFDTIVRNVLRNLLSKYPHIDYAVVLAYIPEKKSENDDFSDTIVPEGIERVPPRFAISWRNNWMLRHSDYIVTYITHDWGGAYKYAQKAIRQSKHVRNLNNSNADFLSQ